MALVSVPTSSTMSARLRTSASVAVTVPPSCIARTLASSPREPAWSTMPPVRSASARTSRMPATSVPSPPNSGRELARSNPAARAAASSSVAA